MRVDDEIVSNYRASRAAFLRDDIEEAERYYRANRLLGTDLYYEVELPHDLLLVHPIGTVLGRANYGNWLVVYHGCGVGSDIHRNRPTLGDGVVLFPGAKVLGRSVIGKNVYITANTVVNDMEVPDNVVVFPHSVVVGPGDMRGSFVITAVEQQPSWKHTNRSVLTDFFSGPRQPSPESLAMLGAV